MSSTGGGPRPAQDLAPRVLAFCRLLREYGFGVTPARSVAAATALTRVDVTDRTDFFLTLRTVLASGRQQQEQFDRLFELFWEGRLAPAAEEPAAAADMQAAAAQDASAQYSAFEALGVKDFGVIEDGEERAAMERTIALIARRLATRRSRRWRPSRRGRTDLRRTMRRSLRLGGTSLEMARRQREVRKPRLVLVCDVSRSMDQYSRFLLQFVHGFQRALGRVQSFVFATRLTRVTRYLRATSIQESVDRLSREVPDWAGGTRMGVSFETLNRDHRAALDGSTTLVVLSDGLDTGEPELLDRQLALLRRRVKRIIWLNPLLGAAEPRLARGMQVALPYVDTFAPGHNLACLEALARRLTA